MDAAQDLDAAEPRPVGASGAAHSQSREMGAPAPSVLTGATLAEPIERGRPAAGVGWSAADQAGAERSALAGADVQRAAEVIPIAAGGPRGVTVRGALGEATVPLLHAAVAQVCRTAPGTENGGTGQVFFLDLREVTFLDASAVSVLGRVHEQIDGQGDELRVAAPIQSTARRLLLLAVLRGRVAPLFSPWST